MGVNSSRSNKRSTIQELRINEAFLIAVWSGNLIQIKDLLDQGADIHYRDDSALISAARNNQLPLVRFLLEHGANLHSQDDEALVVAAMNGHSDIVRELVHHGANISQLSSGLQLRISKYHDIIPLVINPQEYCRLEALIEEIRCIPKSKPDRYLLTIGDRTYILK